ncbi:GNAT family N-acetyltransferase [Robertkochia flava]|uniref:GNAT family N-acetyltransferase n=1 Tax=Robertkochia flava TaxID=3447986 RepID=UPI001CCB2BB1|nr:GNAT family N-acetyltransferase [Robertkochia marina]
MEFTQLTGKEEVNTAFSLYPDDWKEVLLPVWPDYEGTARVYALLQGHRITTLGILFYEKAPEMEAFPETTPRYFSEGKPYIGFLYTLPSFRGRGYASLWLKELRNILPGTSFWLTVEDQGLIPFYEANGFSLEGKSNTKEEWLLRLHS